MITLYDRLSQTNRDLIESQLVEYPTTITLLKITLSDKYYWLDLTLEQYISLVSVFGLDSGTTPAINCNLVFGD